MPAGDCAIRSVAVAADATRVVAANNAGACFVWRVRHLLCVLVSPYPRQLQSDANALDAAATAVAFEPLRKLQAHRTYVLKIAISPDCKTLATASADHTVNVWSMKDFSLLKTLRGHERWVWDCVYSHDSDFLVTASSDHTLRLWDLELGESVREVRRWRVYWLAMTARSTPDTTRR